MSSQDAGALLQSGDCRLGNDGLEQSCDELKEQAPEGGTGQAAAAQCGESSNASTSGSSSRMIKT